MAGLKDFFNDPHQFSADNFDKHVKPAIDRTAQFAKQTVDTAGRGIRSAASFASDTLKSAADSNIGRAARNLGGAGANLGSAAGERAATSAASGMNAAADAANARAEALRNPQPKAPSAHNTGRNPNVPRGGMSAEAQAFRSGGGGRVPPTQTGAAPAGAQPPKRGFFPTAGRVIGAGVRGVGGVQAGMGVADAVNGNFGDAVDNITMGAATALNPVVGTIGNVLTGVRDAGLRLAMPFIQPERNPNIFNDKLNSMVDGKEFTGMADEPVKVAQANTGVMEGRSNANGDVLNGQRIPTVGGPEVSPEDLISGTAVPAEGTGAFKRTTPGNVGRAQRVGTRSDEVKPADSNEDRGLRLPQATTLAGHMVNLAALNANAQAASAKDRGQVAQARLDNNSLKTRIELAKHNRSVEKDASDSFDKEILDEVTRNTDPSLDKETRAATIERDAADYRRRVKHTLGDSSQKLGSMSDAEKQKMHLANKFRTSLEKSREGFWNKVTDYLGNKRFDRENLYTYMPESVKRTATGYDVITKNGNRMTISDAGGGNFVWNGPNVPVDRDIMDEIVKAAQKQSKG